MAVVTPCKHLRSIPDQHRGAETVKEKKQSYDDIRCWLTRPSVAIRCMVLFLFTPGLSLRSLLSSLPRELLLRLSCLKHFTSVHQGLSDLGHAPNALLLPLVILTHLLYEYQFPNKSEILTHFCMSARINTGYFTNEIYVLNIC